MDISSAGSSSASRANPWPATANLQRWRVATYYYTFVILGRSKERSDAAQTLGSICGRRPACNGRSGVFSIACVHMSGL
ncbi:hypothetical protein MES4922_80002 [Mesorhizobium ventifaucium]|uniref:Uncharacterized protein n=1 Tax=Mesorhizobium ventifaucium TaxID=666020 RepID=A0ABM9EE41_9HYPH|nr:hypothetical protein MES4922_80002 [Mesorhizobium ventifaucium]